MNGSSWVSVADESVITICCRSAVTCDLMLFPSMRPCTFDQPLTRVIFTRAAELPFDLYSLCHTNIFAITWIPPCCSISFLDLYCTLNILLKHKILNVNNSYAICCKSDTLVLGKVNSLALGVNMMLVLVVCWLFCRRILLEFEIP